ncbi:MAG: delta-60 repeat domain-containing protein [Flavobacteriales bacterium]|jgi:uncharacterized delta-60 repeat protein|nr:delta-60 repeat domain-containing protein [Flavobacteriales bacterium]
MQAILSSPHRGIGVLLLYFHIALAGAQSGALDTSFDPGSGANVSILRSVVLPNGSYLIAGDFTSYAGVPCGRIARVLPGGGFDPTFVSGTGFNDQVDFMRVQSDGKIIAVGTFTEYDGTNVNRIVRLFPDGSLDGSFQPIAPNTLSASALEVLPDDRVLFAGYFSIPGVPGAVRLARFMPNGALDQVLATGANTNGTVTSILTIPDGRVMIGGTFTAVQGQTRIGIALLTSTGILDTTFDPGTGFETTTSSLQGLILGPSGGIYAVGSFTQYNGTIVNAVVRLLTSGAIDPTWNTSTVYSARANTVLELPGDKIVVGGSFLQVNGVSKPGLCALTLNGDLIPSFPRGTGSVGPIFQFHQLPSGNLFITGNFNTYNGVPRSKIARLIHCPVDEWYADMDNDGAGADSAPVITCTPPAGHVSNSTDCNDNDPLNTVGTIWYADADGDGAGDALIQLTACVAPIGYVDNDDDCNDADPLVIGPILWYMDQDEDGYGNVMAPAQLACIAPPGHVADNTDCNDFDPTVHELSNWYADTDGDGFGHVNALLVACSRPSGYVSNATDCDDDDPLATVVRNWYADTDNDGFGNVVAQLPSCAQPPGHVLDATDCDDSSPTITGPTTWYLDSDGDDFGLTAQTLVACSQPLGYSAGGGDCDDTDPLIYPDAPCNDDNAGTHFDRIRPDCSCAGQGVQVSPIVYLDVPLNAQGWMDATLLANGLLPTEEPYTAMGYTDFANGVGGSATTPQLLDPDPLQPELQAVDWVVVELRPLTTPTQIAAAQPCLLRRNGEVHRPDALATPEFLVAQSEYFISVRHRNHLGIITASSIQLDQAVPLVLNFSDGSAPVNGGPNALKPNGSKLALWPGDVRFNRNVQYAGQNNDRDAILVRIGGVVPTNTVQGYSPEDVNLDGVVKYAGTNNDRDKVLQTVGGVVPTNIRLDHLPN